MTKRQIERFVKDKNNCYIQKVLIAWTNETNTWSNWITSQTGMSMIHFLHWTIVLFTCNKQKASFFTNTRKKFTPRTKGIYVQSHSNFQFFTLEFEYQNHFLPNFYTAQQRKLRHHIFVDMNIFSMVKVTGMSDNFGRPSLIKSWFHFCEFVQKSCDNHTSTWSQSNFVFKAQGLSSFFQF